MKTVKKGDRGEAVMQLQKALSLKADGIFGKLTLEAVKKFQKEKGLAVDGIVGAKTWAALNKKSTVKEPGTAHFKISEFKCKDGTKVPERYFGNLSKLMNMLEEIRKACGNRKTIIISGYRTPAYNKKVGGASGSKHMEALAADIAVTGLTPSLVYAIANNVVGSRGGVGRYKTFVHVDCRGYRARW